MDYKKYMYFGGMDEQQIEIPTVLIYNNTDNHKWGCVGNVRYGFTDLDGLSSHEAMVMRECSGCNG